MPKKIIKTGNLTDLLTLRLQVLYDVEFELVRALAQYTKQAHDSDLKAIFSRHAIETQGHLKRLDDAFRFIGQKPKKFRTETVRGLIKDATWFLKNVKLREPFDAMLISAGQAVEQYETALYSSAWEWARTIGLDDVAEALSETLEEEETVLRDLTDLASSRINIEAHDPIINAG